MIVIVNDYVSVVEWDHVGHIFGVNSPPMIEKLEQYNGILEVSPSCLIGTLNSLLLLMYPLFGCVRQYESLIRRIFTNNIEG